MLFAARDEEMFIVFGVVGVILLVALLIAIFFHLTLMRAIQACAPRNQTMAPGMVWLNFVPCLNIVWQFINVINVGNSLANEYRDRGMRSNDESFGKTSGLTYIILGLVASVLNAGGRVVIEGARSAEMAIVFAGVLGVIGLVQFILWIVYWVKIAGFTNELNNSRGRSRYDDGYDDYSGGRGRGRYDDDYDRDRPRDDRDDDYRRGDDRDNDYRPRDRY